MKKLRKTKRGPKKAAANSQQGLDSAAAQMLDHPKKCCICEADFQRTPETVTTWMVTIREERVRLTCPTCWKIVIEAMENLSDT